FVAAPAHPLARLASLTLEALSDSREPFFHLGSGRLWRRILDRKRLSGNPNIDAPLAMAYQLTLRGMGIALFTSSLVGKDLAAGRLVQLQVEDAEPDSRSIALVRHQRRETLSPVAANFVAVFRWQVERSASLSLAAAFR